VLLTRVECGQGFMNSILQRFLGREFIPSFWVQITIVLFLYFGCSSLGILSSTNGWTKLLLQEGKNFQHWDSIIYVSLALHPKCQAFYPLWPQIIGLFNPSTLYEGLKYSFFISNLMFIASLPCLLVILQRCIQSKWMSFSILLLYALNPNSIFHSIGYTESLFSFFALTAIGALIYSKNNLANIVLGLSAVIMGVCRPSVVQIVAASTFTCICLYFTCGRNLKVFLATSKQYVVQSIILGLGSIIGYSIYGFSCLATTGNFLFPFQAQVQWGRTLSFKPLFLFLPRSLLNDLHGLYFPYILFLIVVILIYRFKNNNKIFAYIPSNPIIWLTLFYPPLAISIYSVQYFRMKKAGELIQYQISPKIQVLQTSYIFYFCISMALANAAIGFLAASESMYSLARFVFATPWFFIAFGMISNVFDTVLTRKFVLGCIVVSSIGLIHQWHNWGQDLWL
jgi:hypothetical protein